LREEKMKIKRETRRKKDNTAAKPRMRPTEVN